MLVGLDEAGCGPIFGSLWAAAVHLEADVEGLADSKTLSERRREALREAVLRAARYGLGEVTATEIDSLGMAEARRLVFERALDDFAARNHDALPTRLVVDGTIFRPWRDVPYECVPRADATVPCVSAASVLAKTTRDAQVARLCDEDPTLDERYGLRKNKGYPSKGHVDGVRVHGRTAHHRASFRVRALEAAATP